MSTQVQTVTGAAAAGDVLTGNIEGVAFTTAGIAAGTTTAIAAAIQAQMGGSPNILVTAASAKGLRFVREFDLAKKPMFIICHGPQILISAQLVRGRTLTGFASIADDIRNAGGLYRDQPTVQDGHWISARGAGDMMLFNRAMLEKLALAGLPQPA